ncbi:MAG: hypothetical protein ACYCX2_05375 [Christensenellales bacterium]
MKWKVAGGCRVISMDYVRQSGDGLREAGREKINHGTHGWVYLGAKIKEEQKVYGQPENKN